KNSVKQFAKSGHPDDDAAKIAVLEYLPSGIGVVEAARAAGVELEVAATAFYGLGERLSLGSLRDALAKLPTSGAWEQIALTGIIMDLRAAQQRLATAYLEAQRLAPKLAVEDFLSRL